MDRISASREASQPLRSKTGGSTFKNPEGRKAWQLVDAAGCRGLMVGGAQVSEKHTHFSFPTRLISHCSSMPLFAFTRRRPSSPSAPLRSDKRRVRKECVR